MRVLIASTFTPFVRGGAEKIVDDLHRELVLRGFATEVALFPFDTWYPDIPSQTAAIRLLDLTESCGDTIDRVITIRTPSYALRHPNKVAWFIHHHREAYDLWGTKWCGMPDDETGRHYRDLMHRSDTIYLKECRKLFTNSKIVADRLRKFNKLEPHAVLYPPLQSNHGFRPGPFGDYILYVSRLTGMKRQDLAVEAMRYTDPDVKLVLGGTPDTKAYGDKVEGLIREHQLQDRIKLAGYLTEEEKVDLTAGCCGAMYLAYDEDSYGYATLEAFHAHKPVITLTDSGGALELIENGYNGYVTEPEPKALAEAMNRFWRDRKAAATLGENAYQTLSRERIDWDHVIENLTA